MLFYFSSNQQRRRMSLGWQTESTFLPRKSKPIQVNNSSMDRLKQLINKEEEKRKLTHSSQTNTEKSTDKQDYKFKRSTKPIAKKKKDDLDIYYAKDYDSLKIEDKARIALEAKSKLYEEARKGNPIGSASLVVFADKPDEPSSSHNLNESYEPHKTSENNPDTLRNPPTLTSAQIIGETNDPWQWSKGTSTANEDAQQTIQQWKTNQIQKKTLQEEIDKRIQEEFIHKQKDIISSVSQPISFASVSSGARIKTQWDQVLQSSSKAFIEEIHQETNKFRQNQSTNDNNSSQEMNKTLTNKRTREDFEINHHSTN